MKKSLLIVAMLFIASIGFAQTAVTLQVTDADSQTWNNGTYIAALSSTWTQNPTASAYPTAALNATGGASLTLAAGTYEFYVCPAAQSVGSGAVGNLSIGSTSSGCYSTQQAISGGSQTVTLAPPAIRIAAAVGKQIRAYADAEVLSPIVASRYFNLTNGVDRLYNGTVWTDASTNTAQTFATLPACAAGTEGMRRSITDSSTVVWGATVTGSSTNHIIAYCDGTNWTVLGK